MSICIHHEVNAFVAIFRMVSTSQQLRNFEIPMASPLLPLFFFSISCATGLSLGPLTVIICPLHLKHPKDRSGLT